MIDLKKIIIPTNLINYTNETKNSYSECYKTRDLVFVKALDDIDEEFPLLNIAYSSYYAYVNCAGYFMHSDGESVPYWLRSSTSKDQIFSNQLGYARWVDENGRNSDHSMFEAFDTFSSVAISTRPCINIDIKKTIKEVGGVENLIIESYSINGKIVMFTIELGEYPKSKAENSDELEKLFQHNMLKPTGKIYTGVCLPTKHPSFMQNPEFEYNGKKYVRVISLENSTLRHNKSSTHGQAVWIVVEPIKWTIKNWESLPKSINPTGDGSDNFMELESTDAIISGIPFNFPHLHNNDDLEKIVMWQNSLLRAYLNGYPPQIAYTNGDKNYAIDVAYDFKGKGFIDEAFIINSPYTPVNEEKVASNLKFKEWLNNFAIPKKLHPLLINYIMYKYKQSYDESAQKIYSSEFTEKALDKEAYIDPSNENHWLYLSSALYKLDDILSKKTHPNEKISSIVSPYRMVDGYLKSNFGNGFALDFMDYYFYYAIHHREHEQKELSKVK